MYLGHLESSAKKEIRNHGGIRSAETIYVTGESPVRTFALRIFLSSLFLKRRDVTFVSSLDKATLVLTDASLDTVSAEMLTAVLDGTVTRYLQPPHVRTIAPFAAVDDATIGQYAAENGWHQGFVEQNPGDTALFLQEFVRTRPGAKFALKNIADKLSMISHQE